MATATSGVPVDGWRAKRRPLRAQLMGRTAGAERRRAGRPRGKQTHRPPISPPLSRFDSGPDGRADRRTIRGGLYCYLFSQRTTKARRTVWRGGGWLGLKECKVGGRCNDSWGHFSRLGIILIFDLTLEALSQSFFTDFLSCFLRKFRVPLLILSVRIDMIRTLITLSRNDIILAKISGQREPFFARSCSRALYHQQFIKLTQWKVHLKYHRA